MYLASEQTSEAAEALVGPLWHQVNGAAQHFKGYSHLIAWNTGISQQRLRLGKGKSFRLCPYFVLGTVPVASSKFANVILMAVP